MRGVHLFLVDDGINESRIMFTRIIQSNNVKRGESRFNFIIMPDVCVRVCVRSASRERVRQCIATHTKPIIRILANDFWCADGINACRA